VGDLGTRSVWIFAVLAALAGCDTRVDAAMRPAKPEAPLSLAPPTPVVVPSEHPVDIPALVARVDPAVVDVVAMRSGAGFDFLPPGGLFDKLSPPPTIRDRAVGSGFLIAPDGLVLTNDHVVEDADLLRVRLSDQREFPAKVLGHDDRLDVALLKLEGARELPVVELGSSEATRVGDWVVAMGNPYGLGRSVTVGIVSARARPVGSDSFDYYLQTDAAINPGNSGGPLFNAAGQVIGINTAIAAHGRGIGFAIPIDEGRPVLDELRDKGRLRRGHMGVVFQPLTQALSRAMKLPSQNGALVSELEPRGTADSAGIKPGDVITSVAGRPIEKAYDLLRYLGRLPPGKAVQVTVIREGRARTIAVTLGREDDDNADEGKRAPVPATRWPMLGVRATDERSGGARVAAIEPESPAAEVLTPGDVIMEMNGAKVRGAADLAGRLIAASRPGAVFFRVRRGTSFVYVGIEVPQGP